VALEDGVHLLLAVDRIDSARRTRTSLKGGLFLRERHPRGRVLW